MLRVSNMKGLDKLFQRKTSSLPRCWRAWGYILAAFSGSDIFFARRKRITGAYVSRRTGIPTAPATPDKTATTMKTHLNPIVSAINPPAIGPTAGPIRGPKLNTAIADALSRSGKTSLTVPPPHAIGALPKKPPVDCVGDVEFTLR